MHFILAQWTVWLQTIITCPVSPTAVIVYMENIGSVYPAMSMMVLGSFASYTKTKSVKSGCLLTRDDDVEQRVLEQVTVNGDRNT